jgi:hypothetical protein
MRMPQQAPKSEAPLARGMKAVATGRTWQATAARVGSFKPPALLAPVAPEEGLRHPPILLDPSRLVRSLTCRRRRLSPFQTARKRQRRRSFTMTKPGIVCGRPLPAIACVEHTQRPRVAGPFSRQEVLNGADPRERAAQARLGFARPLLPSLRPAHCQWDCRPPGRHRVPPYRTRTGSSASRSLSENRSSLCDPTDEAE